MRRPLCLFCAGALGVELVCAFLPQAWLLPLLAAFFVLCLLAVIWKRAAVRRRGLCLLLGGLLGLTLVLCTYTKWERLKTTYDGQTVTLTAEVERVSTSYYPGVVNAVLHVQAVEGEPAAFRIECAALPKCCAGERVQGTFTLERIPETEQLTSYADGVVLSAELTENFRHLGISGSFRARTARLQARLSAALRRGMEVEAAGVLAAMVTGDRTHLSSRMRKAYRGAGLSHVLVVSGMHVSILCGSVLDRFRPRRKRQRRYASCRRKALLRTGMAVLLVGVTGFTPSVLRAGVAVWISALGIWVYGPADALTSLGVAGVLMTLGNSYAICDIGFELSFAAVAGTLAGAELFQRSREAQRRKAERTAKQKRAAGTTDSAWMRWGRKGLSQLWETVCISGCACAATFPVLVLRGMSASLYALVSSAAVLWLVEPILLLGLATALSGLFPVLEPLHTICAWGAETLVALLDRWALWVSGWPGAQLWFDTAYAAIVCLLLIGLCWLAFHWKLRLRVALLALLLTAALAIGAGNFYSRDVVRVELVGTKTAPAVVITQNDRAVVLYRGGKTTRNAVQDTLERRNIRTVEAVIDLRMDPQDACGLDAEQMIPVRVLPSNTERILQTETARLEILRMRSGCAVRITAAGQTFLTLSGTVQFAQPLRVDWLLASMSRPSRVEYRNIMTKSTRYRWMGETTAWQECTALRFRPGD